MSELGRLLELVGDPRLASELPADDARALLGEVAALTTGLGALQSVLLPRAIGQDVGGRFEEVLLTPEEAAAIAGVTAGQLLDITRGRRLKFRRRLSHKIIRFEEGGLRRWLASTA